MDPIMIGIAAVVIMVICAGIFFMKKGKTNTTVDTQTNVKRPKTLAEQQRELELQRQSQQPTPTAFPSMPQSALSGEQTAHTELQDAEQLIHSQDYEGAITILRRAVKNHPTHTSLHFALLNTYALAKDYEHFNAFYLEVLALNDFDLTTQANNLKILVDEEQLTSSTAIPDVYNATDNALDFDLFDVKQGAEKPSVDALEGLSSSSTAIPTVSSVTESTNTIVSKANSDIDFDFSLDDVETKASPVAMEVKTNTDTTINSKLTNPPADELTFDDLDFDLPSKPSETSMPVVEAHTEIFAPVASPSVVPVTTTTASDSDFDFDFNLPESQSTTISTTTSDTTFMSASSATDKIADDFDFDFDLAVEPVSNDTATPITASAAPESTSEPTLEALDAPSLPSTSTDNLTSAHPAAQAITDPDDIEPITFDLDDELLLQADAAAMATAAKPVVEVPAEQNPSDTLSLSDEKYDFTLDDAPVPTTETTPDIITSTPVLIDDDIDLSFDEPAVVPTSPDTPVAAAPTATTTAPVTEALSAVFDVIKDIDTDTLNVDLAEQYLNLGEYDSAKRLLDEIKDSDNTALLERAKTLRQRIA